MRELCFKLHNLRRIRFLHLLAVRLFEALILLVQDQKTDSLFLLRCTGPLLKAMKSFTPS